LRQTLWWPQAESEDDPVLEWIQYRTESRPDDGEVIQLGIQDTLSGAVIDPHVNQELWTEQRRAFDDAEGDKEAREVGNEE
jgi:hypothetical protein